MTTMLTYTLAVQAFEDRDYNAAVDRFTEVLAEDPHNRTVREYLARALYHRASLKPAEAELRTLLAEDPATSTPPCCSPEPSSGRAATTRPRASGGCSPH